jgi:hypothetical protein
MAESVNTQLSDRFTTRHLQVRRVESKLRRDLWAMLAMLETDLLGTLKQDDPTDFVLLARRRRAVEALIEEELAPLITSRYDRMAALATAVLVRLARSEAGVVQDIVNAATGDDTITALPSDASLRASVVATLFPSADTPTDLSTTGEEWWTRQAESLTQRLGDSLMVGVALEESLTDLARRIRGTSDNAFKDGLMEKARQDAARLLTTQTTNAVSEAHVAVGDVQAQAAGAPAPARSNLILVHSSVLDNHTSTMCLARHGLRYTIDTHEPIGHSIAYLSGPPYHPNCRSQMLVVLRDGGALPEANLSAWLRRQGTAVQEEVLGVTRGQMFRDGKLSPRELIDAATGRPLTLEELGA